MAQVLPLPIVKREKPISVIMVSYMTGPALLEAVNAVVADPDIFELILVDNGNTQDARKRLSQFVSQHDHIRLLQGHGNIGFGRACNYGAQLARGEYLLFLNPDALIESGSARALANCGKTLTAPWVTGGMLRDVHGREQRGGRRGALTPKHSKTIIGKSLTYAAWPLMATAIMGRAWYLVIRKAVIGR